MHIHPLEPARINIDQGQLTSEDYGDIYFNPHKGIAESNHVFLQGGAFYTQLQRYTHLVICETGFGTGLNFLITLHAFHQHSRSDQYLDYFSIEKHPIDLSTLKKIYHHIDGINADPLLSSYPPHCTPGLQRINFPAYRVTLTIYFGDLEQGLTQIPSSVDIWYLDGFAPQKNPEMWTTSLYATLAKTRHNSTTVATFTAAGSVKRGLLSAGFVVDKKPGFGQKREMITAQAQPDSKPRPAHRKQKRIAIVGAGISGATLASALAHRGHYATVFERQSIHQGASGNPAGLMSPAFNQRYTTASCFMLSAFYCSRQLVLGSNTTALATGALYPYDGKKNPSKWQNSAIRQYFEQRDDGMFFKDAITLSPRRWVQELLDHINIEIRLYHHIEQHQINDDGIIVATNHKEKAFFDAIVYATGADSIDALPDFKPWVRPIKGQLTGIKHTENTSDTPAICHDKYLLPADNGATRWCGASYRKEAPEHCTDAENIENISAIAAFLTEPATVIASRSSYRLCTKDYMPIAGQLPDLKQIKMTPVPYQMANMRQAIPHIANTYVHIGHGSRGLTTAALCSELLAQMIDLPDWQPSWWASPVNPARFWLRNQ